MSGDHVLSPSPVSRTGFGFLLVVIVKGELIITFDVHSETVTNKCKHVSRLQTDNTYCEPEYVSFYMTVYNAYPVGFKRIFNNVYLSFCFVDFDMN